MKNKIKLSDLNLPGTTSESKAGDVMLPDDMEMNRVKTEYNTEMNTRKRELSAKISNLETKLKKHEQKEGMLDRIINETYTEMDNLSQNEFTRRGQKQSILIKQLEALSILHDTILKYEGMIQTYHKILMDIENNKLNSYIKVMNLKKEEEKTDDGLNEVLQDLQSMLKSGNVTPGSNPLLDEIQQELAGKDY